MNNKSQTPSSYTPSFPSTGSALRTLRKGKRNPNWRAAAEYLIEHASPEVELMLEVDRAMQQGRPITVTTEPKQRNWKPWLLAGLAVVLCSSVTAYLVWLLTRSGWVGC